MVSEGQQFFRNTDRIISVKFYVSCRFRFQCGTGGVREINVLRKESAATFSVSIETEATFLLFQLGLVDRVIVLSMSASCSSAKCPTLEGER